MYRSAFQVLFITSSKVPVFTSSDVKVHEFRYSIFQSCHPPIGIREQWARKRFPGMKDIVYKWSGQVMEPLDSLAFIGRNPGDDDIYIVTGDSGNGMTHCTIAGMLISDLINDKKNPWEKIFSPSRITLKTAGDYFKEVGNMAAQYADVVSAGDLSTAHDLKPGEGGIMARRPKKNRTLQRSGGFTACFFCNLPSFRMCSAMERRRKII